MGIVLWLAGFWIWLKMRLDYDEEKILSLLVVVGFGSIFGVLGGLAGLWIYCKRQNWNFWEWLDVFGVVGLAMYAVSGGELRLVVGGIGVVWVIWLGRNYRKIFWYKSGRVGLAGLCALMWWSGGEIVVAMWSKLGLYWGGLTVSQWVSVVVLSVSATVLLLRGNDRFVWRKRR